MVAKAILNNELVSEKPIGKTDLFASFTKDVSLESLPDNSTLHFEKTGQ